MTKLIIALNFAIFVLFNLASSDEIFLIFGLNMFFTNGFFWQPLSCMFVHANLMHILMNMAVLYHFGMLFENFFGSKKFILIYLLGGILTSILSFIFIYFSFSQGKIINMVGASGAISMLLGMLAFIDKNNAKGLLIAILLMSFAPMLMGINVAWYAHIIGFGIGYFSLRFRLI
ncbi:MAG: rhomboid family intramembrane serine protease [Campylobacter sp.]